MQVLLLSCLLVVVSSSSSSSSLSCIDAEIPISSSLSCIDAEIPPSSLSDSSLKGLTVPTSSKVPIGGFPSKKDLLREHYHGPHSLSNFHPDGSETIRNVLKKVPDCLRWKVEETRQDLERIHDCVLAFWPYYIDLANKLGHSSKFDSFRLIDAKTLWLKQQRFVHDVIEDELDHGDTNDLNTRLLKLNVEIKRLLVWSNDAMMLENGEFMDFPDYVWNEFDKFDQLH